MNRSSAESMRSNVEVERSSPVRCRGMLKRNHSGDDLLVRLPTLGETLHFNSAQLAQPTCKQRREDQTEPVQQQKQHPQVGAHPAEMDCRQQDSGQREAALQGHTKHGQRQVLPERPGGPAEGKLQPPAELPALVDVLTEPAPEAVAGTDADQQVQKIVGGVPGRVRRARGHRELGGRRRAAGRLRDAIAVAPHHQADFCGR